MEERVHQTMAETNRAIMQWFNGSLPDTDEGFAAVSRYCHPDMTYVFPSGGVQNASSFLTDLRSVHGTNPLFKLATLRAHTKLLFEDAALVAAEIVELQDGAKFGPRPRHARRTTILCLKDQDGPHGLLISRLHESYLSEAEEAGLDWAALDA